MHGDVLGAILSFGCLTATVILMIRLRQKKAVHILDYQAGVRFNGADPSTLKPGVYFTNPGSDPITVVDMRPYQFVLERQVYKDALHSSFVMSLGGEVQVSDPQLAVTGFKNLVRDSLAVVYENVRSAASRSIAHPGVEARGRIAATLEAELNRELEARGIKVRGIEITELWIQKVQGAIPTTAN